MMLDHPLQCVVIVPIIGDFLGRKCHVLQIRTGGLLVQDDEPLDRTTMNSWEDVQFVDAVRATGRRKLILCALWTEICMAFVALDALREGYEVYPVVDAIGGTSLEAHRAGLERTVRAGAQPISWVSLAGELQRDWARQETVPALVEIVLSDRLLKESADVEAPV